MNLTNISYILGFVKLDVTKKRVIERFHHPQTEEFYHQIARQQNYYPPSFISYVNPRDYRDAYDSHY